MATAKKLPSGSWRCRVFSHVDESGKKIYKSFTCDDPSKAGKRKCEAEASAWADKKKELKKSASGLTLGEAMDKYIAGRSSVLSPNSIKDYKNTRRLHLQSIINVSVDALTETDIQTAINEEALKLSPKTVRNINGFLTAVLNTYRPGFHANVRLPQKKRVDYNIPADKDVTALIADVRGSEMELPIMLAAFGPMRRGEICALRTENISGNIVHVCENMVQDGPDKWIIRHPKSYAGDRFIDYPDFVAKLFPTKKGRVCELTPTALTRRFQRITKRLGLHFRLHDLRHYSASIQHAMGIPDAYIMQRGGWASDGVLKAVYRHTLEDKTKEMDNKVNSYFESVVNGKKNTGENSGDKAGKNENVEKEDREKSKAGHHSEASTDMT